MHTFFYVAVGEAEITKIEERDDMDLCAKINDTDLEFPLTKDNIYVWYLTIS